MVFQTRVLVGDASGVDHLLGMVFAGTIVVYNSAAESRWRRIGAWFFFPIALVCWWFLPVDTRIVSLAPALIWALYQGIPGRAGLRDYPWAKPPAVALVWALITVYLPLPVSAWPCWAGVLLQQALFIMALALGYDLLDRSIDRRQGLRTLAGELGVQATLRVLYICLGLSGLLAGLNAAAGIYSFHFLTGFVFSLAVSAWLIPWQLKRFGPQQWQKMTIDGLMVVQAIACAMVWGWGGWGG